MRNLIHRPEGFTLIELMIVILIIAILVAIAVPVYLNSKTNAEKRTCQANQRTVDGAIECYQANDTNQSYPNSLGALTGANVTVVKTIPTCPKAGAYSWSVGGANTPPYISCTTHPAQG